MERGRRNKILPIASFQERGRLVSDLDAWFVPIYTANYSRLIKLAYYILWDDRMAEDIVQNAFSALLIKRDQLREHPNISGWLTITVRNMADNERNRAQYTREVPLLPKHETAAESPQDFMSLLPPELSESERQILYLHIEAGLSHKEIAARLGCKPEASRMRLSRARQRCGEFLRKNNCF
ncbi:sigma-70 family RNA polymerase sigma factor [uncultured Oscillibacter sp.]|uniref:RNA polymerase sigma factor n=1 Tax=uncultured Oscillibacter sp. TaxID=876091 RepID=UPI00342A909A